MSGNTLGPNKTMAYLADDGATVWIVKHPAEYETPFDYGDDISAAIVKPKRCVERHIWVQETTPASGVKPARKKIACGTLANIYYKGTTTSVTIDGVAFTVMSRVGERIMK